MPPALCKGTVSSNPSNQNFDMSIGITFLLFFLKHFLHGDVSCKAEISQLLNILWVCFELNLHEICFALHTSLWQFLTKSPALGVSTQQEVFLQGLSGPCLPLPRGRLIHKNERISRQGRPVFQIRRAQLIFTSQAQRGGWIILTF